MAIWPSSTKKHTHTCLPIIVVSSSKECRINAAVRLILNTEDTDLPNIRVQENDVWITFYKYFMPPMKRNSKSPGPS